MRRYVIIGNGVAGTTAAENIREMDKEGKIDIITDESTLFYTRIRLPEYIAAEVEEERIVLHKPEWYRERNIVVHLGKPVTDIDQAKREIYTTEGTTLNYDRLLLATGSHSFVPPIRGVDKPGVFTLRTIKDAQDIRDYAAEAKRVILIGGGVLGLEAGNGLRRRGIEVTVVEFFPRLLPRQMDVPGAELLQRQMEEMGFSFHLGAKSQEIRGTQRVEGLLLEDGQILSADMVLISAGVRPNLDLAQKIGLEVDRGVLVNDRLETQFPDIYGAGDLIQHRGIFYGIWPASEKQGQVAGINMAGGDALYEGTVMSNRLKVVGIDLVSAGDIDADEKLEKRVQKDEQRFIYRKLVLKDGILVGCILFGDISGAREILHAIENKKNVQALKDDLLVKGFDFKRLES
ncbi:MAG: FAD-dependent oxidoreductase [Proteobacteria bacterium]|nr:FAD-dependent oxidoreductase [Pseudomonadota bacterium]NIS68353.1 FAD-dependent oxidoreductase [Pseudomonadota bacterium]